VVCPFNCGFISEALEEGDSCQGGSEGGGRRKAEQEFRLFVPGGDCVRCVNHDDGGGHGVFKVVKEDVQGVFLQGGVFDSFLDGVCILFGAGEVGLELLEAVFSVCEFGGGEVEVCVFSLEFSLEVSELCLLVFEGFFDGVDVIVFVCEGFLELVG